MNDRETYYTRHILPALDKRKMQRMAATLLTLSSQIHVYRLQEIKVFTFNAMFFYASARTEQIDVDLLLFSPDLICVFLFPLILILSIVIFFTERRINSGPVLGLNLIGNIQEPTINKNNSIFQHNRDSTSTLLYFFVFAPT